MRTPRRSLYLRTLAAALGAVALGEILVPCMALADIPAIAQRQRAEKKTFTDSEIVDGFLKTAFGAEYHLAGRVDRIRKYDGPVRVFADGPRADRKAQLAKIVADIAARVQHLDIAMAGTIEDANVQVKLVRDRDLQRTITTFYGSERVQAGRHRPRGGGGRGTGARGEREHGQESGGEAGGGDHRHPSFSACRPKSLSVASSTGASAPGARLRLLRLRL